jgi:hypothetical protein
MRRRFVIALLVGIALAPLLSTGAGRGALGDIRTEYDGDFVVRLSSSCLAPGVNSRCSTRLMRGKHIRASAAKGAVNRRCVAKGELAKLGKNSAGSKAK